MWEESSRSFGTGRTEQIDIQKPSLTIIKLLSDSIGPCCEGALSRGWPHPTYLLLCHSQMFQECQLNKGHKLTETCSRLQTFYSLNPCADPIVSLVQYCLLAILKCRSVSALSCNVCDDMRENERTQNCRQETSSVI